MRLLSIRILKTYLSLWKSIASICFDDVYFLYLKKTLETNEYVSGYRGTVSLYSAIGALDSALIYNEMGIRKCRLVNDIGQEPWFIAQGARIHKRIGNNIKAKELLVKAIDISENWINRQNLTNTAQHSPYIHHKFSFETFWRCLNFCTKLKLL